MAEPISPEETEKPDVEAVHGLYRTYLSKSQSPLMTSFGFGRDPVDRAEGSCVHTR